MARIEVFHHTDDLNTFVECDGDWEDWHPGWYYCWTEGGTVSSDPAGPHPTPIDAASAAGRHWIENHVLGPTSCSLTDKQFYRENMRLGRIVDHAAGDLDRQARTQSTKR